MSHELADSPDQRAREAGTDPAVERAAEILAEPLSEDLNVEIDDAARGMSGFTRSLLLVVLLVLAFAGGVWARSAMPSSANLTVRDQGATTVEGTVQRSEGSTLYATGGDGRPLRITLPQPDQVEVAKPGSVADLSPGARVRIEGKPGNDGSLDASHVTKMEK